MSPSRTSGRTRAARARPPVEAVPAETQPPREDPRAGALSRYQVDSWGGGYFSIDEEGFATVTPEPGSTAAVRISEIVEELRRRGFRSPFLLRFPQILKHRVRRLHEAFAEAIREFGYPNSYQGVFPVKVNQQKVVVDALAEMSPEFRYGLEVGSKAELVLALTQDLHPEAIIICNGYKDRDYVELALRGAHAGSRVILICETQHEVRDVLAIAQEIGVTPALGLRMRLNSKGAGKWIESGGSHAKFGLSTMEILEAIRLLHEAGCPEVLKALHFHIGSQISEILAIKEAVKEAARLYCHIARRAPGLSILDMGGGLGVDYDGSSTASDWSRNYSLDQYGRECVYNVLTVCKQEAVTPPLLVTESGRAVVAYGSLTVVSPLKVIGSLEPAEVPLAPDACHQVKEMKSGLAEMTRENWREVVNDARALQDEVLLGFKLGFVSLEDRAAGEALYIEICRKALAVLDPEESDPEEVGAIRTVLAPMVVCNFSVFQSTPDTWAVRQVFPIMPLSRLTDGRVTDATIGDITCDSDGCIDDFLGETGVCQKTIPLAGLSLDEPYYIGIFLVGAYQDTLGDFHNLFGSANEAAVCVDGPREFRIVNQYRGTTVSEAMNLFGYERQGLVSRFEDRHGGDDSPDTARYRDCFLRVLSSGTYLRR
jgi:arginine decarboxylase